MRYLLLLIILLAGCVGKSGEIKDQQVDITLTTSDGIKIAGTFYSSQNENPKGVILLHMLGRNRGDWNNFARVLQDHGYSVIAIDLRGHGESELDWKNFNSEDFNAMIKDVEVAVEYLFNSGASEIDIIGASIGANVALNYAVLDKRVKKLVLLSPGLDYRGVNTEIAIGEYGERPILIVASEEDEYSAQSARVLFNRALGNKQIKIFKGAGHGTKMFSNKDLEPLLLEWLEAE